MYGNHESPRRQEKLETGEIRVTSLQLEQGNPLSNCPSISGNWRLVKYDQIHPDTYEISIGNPEDAWELQSNIFKQTI